MSSAVGAEVAQLNFIGTCCVVSAGTLLVFEYLITWDKEYRLVWKRKFTAATLFFLLNRYTILMAFILTFPTSYPLPKEGCIALGWITIVLQALPPLFWAGFSSLRAYALSERNWKIAFVIFILSLVPFGLDFSALARQEPVEAPPPINCTAVSSFPLDINNILVPVSRSAVFVADALVLAVTIRKTYQTRKLAKEANVKTSLSSLLLRDGTLYFITLLILNIVDIVLNATQQFVYVTTFFIAPITAIIISRFILNLRGIDLTGNDSTLASRPSFVRSQMSLRFAAFVDPLGAPLDHGVSSEEWPSDEGQEPEDTLANQPERGSVSGASEAIAGPSTAGNNSDGMHV